MTKALPPVLALAALAATLADPRSALAQAPRAVSVQPPVVGRAAPEPEGNEFFPDFSRFRGKLIYAWDNARYDSGFKWPWQNYLAERIQSNAAPNLSPQARSHEVSLASAAFVYEPKYLPDGESFLFKVGDPTNSAGTYDLYWYKPSSRQVQVVAKSLSYRNVWPSPSGRFVATIAGAWEIPLRGGVTPAELHVFDLKSGKDFLIRSGTGDPKAEPEPLLETIAWTPQDRLIYSPAPVETPVTPKEAPTAPAAAEAKPWFPDLYQLDVAQAVSKQTAGRQAGGPKYLQASLWQPNAYRALPSPDGQWMVLLRDETPPKPEKEAAPTDGKAPPAPRPSAPRVLNWILLNANGGSRLLVEPANRSATQFMWSPDSKRLLLMSRQFKGAIGSAAARKALMQIQVGEYDLATQKQRKVGSLDYVAPPGSDLRDDNPLLRPLSISRDGQWLFVELLQFEEKPNNGLLLKAMRLEDGQVLALCRLVTVRRLDWFDN